MGSGKSLTDFPFENMTKASNIIKLINLFIKRYSISISEISKSCGISKRSVYRYLNVLSEANFPIYYDKSAKGYRLNKTFTLKFEYLTAEEVIYICSGLKLLSSKVNEIYCKEIEGLIQKILSMQGLPLDVLWESIESDIDNNALGEDLTYHLNASILRYAILYEKSLKIHLNNSTNGNKDLKIKRPSICFNKKWQLKDAHSTDDQVIPLSNIGKATTLRYSKS
jgi:predicted DNA-binding transcriptional regulator YafY